MYPPYPPGQVPQDPAQYPGQGQQYPGQQQPGAGQYPGQQQPAAGQYPTQTYVPQPGYPPQDQQGYAGYPGQPAPAQPAQPQPAQPQPQQGYAAYGAGQNQAYSPYGAGAGQPQDYYGQQQAQAAYGGVPSPYGGYPQTPAQRAIPAPVQYAVYAMFVGALLEIISIIVDVSTHAGTGATYFGGVVGVGIWIWMALTIRAGKNWARITGTVFFGIDCLVLLLLIIVVADAGLGFGALAVSVLIWLTGLITTILIYRPQSSAYFTQRQVQQYW